MASFCTVSCMTCRDAKGAGGAVETWVIETWAREGWDALHVTAQRMLTCCGQRMHVIEGPKKILQLARNHDVPVTSEV